MKAVWNDQIVAEASKEDLIYIEGNWYFPATSVNQDFLRTSNTPYTCPWKGVCQFYDVGTGDNWSLDNAWCYPNPMESAIHTVKKDFGGYVAFYRDVKVEE